MIRNYDFIYSIIIALLILYMIKTLTGIDFVSGCHVEQVISLTCNADQIINNNPAHNPKHKF